MPRRGLAVVAALAIALCAAGHADAHARRPRQAFRVIVVPGLGLDDLASLAPRGAVGLLVPAKGPATSWRAALAALVRGVAPNARLGGLPRGPVLIRATVSRRVPRRGPAVVLGLPGRAWQPNDRRYPIAVIGRGYRGLLGSPTTRIPGVVSIADVAPIALHRRPRFVASTSRPNSYASTATLEKRIAAARRAKLPASLLVAGFVVLVALRSGRRALGTLAGALLANLALGAIGTTSAALMVAGTAAGAAAGAALPPRLRTDDALGILSVGVLVAYGVALARAPAAVALTPFGPEETGRFFGVSNLLETFLLAPALAGAGLLGRRFGAGAFAAVAAAALAIVAENRLGADGGGAFVLAAGFAVLATGLAGSGRRAQVLAFAGAPPLAAALITLDLASGGSNHLRSAFTGGLPGLGAVLADRAPLSYARALEQWPLVFPLLGLLVAAFVALRKASDPRRQALALAALAALGTSLALNDSPFDVALAGFAGFLALVQADLFAEALPAAAPAWAGRNLSLADGNPVARVSA